MTTRQTIETAIETATTLVGSGVITTGVCLNCCNEQDGVEPDAAGYECAACGEWLVMGAEQILVVYG